MEHYKLTSQSSERQKSPSNDFPSLMDYSQFAAQSFLPLSTPLAPITPLALTLPLIYGQTSKPRASADGRPFNISGDFGPRRNPEITKAQFTSVALKGCEIAEKILNNHKNRPCFKKIDSLCARLKLDVLRTDSVLANINSQGIAWAVKDMIFTFTRIINAWNIMKGYMYDVQPGLKKVKESCSEDFDESFNRWEEASLAFLKELVESYEKLDHMVQTQKSRHGSNGKREEEKPKQGNSSHQSQDEISDVFSQMSLFQMMQTSAADGGGYMRTGVYNSLQTTASSQQINPDQLLQWEQSVFSQRNPTPVAAEAPVKLLSKPLHEELTDDKAKFAGDSEQMLILILLSKLYEMKDASLFFNKHFTKNYVPDYVASAFSCNDIKTIMMSIEKHSYLTLMTIVKDLAAIIYDAKSYVKEHPENDFLASNTRAFENELKTILGESVFSNFNFDEFFIDP
ncbi:protein mitoshell [Phlebotomus argentipes]|uniref:protein mitoshell n=1 Tax=Phlebotomus argentipes TaxID=94469 RepID=UPI002892D454|nr:protein mitoshell [Phlebotomus argentipes]